MSQVQSAEPLAAEGQGGADLFELLARRASVRKFLPQPIPEETLARIVDHARRAPTSSNLQAYSILVVRERASLQALAAFAGGQRQVAEAPALLVFCADLHRLSEVVALRGGSWPGDNLDLSLVAVTDAALVGMSASLLAESLGLGSVMIGGLRNDPEGVASHLALPPRVFVLFGLALGVPAEYPPAKPRLPEGLVVFQERYGEAPPDAAAIAEYDQHIAHFHQNDNPHAWSGRVAADMAAPKRLELRAQLARLGWQFK